MLSPISTVLFLFLYHLGLFYLGCFFFDNLLFKDFEKNLDLIKVIFCFSFVLCSSMLSMLLFEILGFMNHALKLVAWYIDISLLNSFVYIIIPGSVIYTYVTYEDETFSKGLYKFKYFYSLMNKVQESKKFNRKQNQNSNTNNGNSNNGNSNNGSVDSKNDKNPYDKNNKEEFLKRLVYVNEGIKKEIEYFNKKLQLRNRKRMGKILLGCFMFLPLLWFVFYKVSKIIVNNDNNESGDFLNENHLLLKDFVNRKTLKNSNDKIQEGYDHSYDYVNNFIFVKIIQHLLTYISITGMTIVSALSAFTSIYSPYKQIHNFFFFVTIKKVKIIEKKIHFLTDQLSSKKKILVLYKNAHIVENCLEMKTYLSKNGKEQEFLFHNIELEEFIATPGTPAYSSQQDCSAFDTNFDNTANVIKQSAKREIVRERIREETDTETSCTWHFDNSFPIDKRHNYNEYDVCKNYSQKSDLGIHGGRTFNTTKITTGDTYKSNSNIFNHNNSSRNIQNNLYGNIKNSEEKCPEQCYISQLKKRNLYLDSVSSIYKGIIDTFLKEKNTYNDMMGNNKKYIRQDKGHHREIVHEPLDMCEIMSAAPPRLELDPTELKSRENSTAFAKKEEKYKNAENSVFKRNIHSNNAIDEERNSKRFLFFFKKKKKTRFNDCDLVEDRENIKCYDKDSDKEIDTENSFLLNKRESWISRIVTSAVPLIFKKNSNVKKTLPHNIHLSKKNTIRFGSLPKKVSLFISKHMYIPYNAVKNAINVFRKQKENPHKKKKETLIQDINALEYLLMKFFFLLDEVIKEQIRIKQSSTVAGICMYILNCIMSLLCFYKIIRSCYIIYMIEIYYRFITTYTEGHVLLLFYKKHINISLINEVTNLLNIVRVNVNLNEYVTVITSILLISFIFLNLISFMDRIIKLKYSAKSSLYSNLAILLMCEVMNFYFAAYCIILFSFLPFQQRQNVLYIFFNNNVLNLCKLLYHSDVVYVCTLLPSIIFVRYMHKSRAQHFKKI